MDDGRSKLTIPLADTLVKYIKKEYPEMAHIIISAVELSVKNSKNHYLDVSRALEPFLKEKTKILVDKLFMFRKRKCREWPNCKVDLCLFSHDDDENNKRQFGDSDMVKRFKENNNEVVLNKVDELKYSVQQITKYASRFGLINSFRRLNKGKFLITFNSPEDAKKMIECTESVLKDPEIKKFYNVYTPNGNIISQTSDLKYHNTTDIFTPTVHETSVDNQNIVSLENTTNFKNPKDDINFMLSEQKELLDNLSVSFDNLTFISLKNITMRIKNYILSNDNLSSKNSKKGSDSIENSIYYNMFKE